MERKKQNTNAMRALLIEDCNLSQKIMTNFLQKLNYTVDLVARDKESVKTLLNKEYSLIVIGISNKEYAKDEFISLIRESKNIGTPVIAWSEFIDEKNQIIFDRWGADNGLPKVCTRKDLKIVIDKCSSMLRYERKYLYKRINITEKWAKYGERMDMLEQVFRLPVNQLIDLAYAIAIYMEYYLLKTAHTQMNKNGINP